MIENPYDDRCQHATLLARLVVMLDARDTPPPDEEALPERLATAVARMATAQARIGALLAHLSGAVDTGTAA